MPVPALVIYEALHIPCACTVQTARRYTEEVQCDFSNRRSDHENTCLPKYLPYRVSDEIFPIVEQICSLSDTVPAVITLPHICIMVYIESSTLDQALTATTLKATHTFCR